MFNFVCNYKVIPIFKDNELLKNFVPYTGEYDMHTYTFIPLLWQFFHTSVISISDIFVNLELLTCHSFFLDKLVAVSSTEYKDVVSYWMLPVRCVYVAVFTLVMWQL